MTDERFLRDEICRIGRCMWDKNYVAANDGNISVRLGQGRYLCTPTLISKGFMTPDDLIVVNDDGQKIEGSREATSEIRMHVAIYRARADVNAVCHAHPPISTAFAITEEPIPTCVLPEVETLLGPVPITPYATPGSPQVAENILPAVRNHANTILMSHHGPVAFDTTLELAWFHLETLENYCRIVLACKQIGRLPKLTDENIAAILETKKRLGIPDPRL